MREKRRRRRWLSVEMLPRKPGRYLSAKERALCGEQVQPILKVLRATRSPKLGQAPR